MSLKRNAKQNIELSCSALLEVTEYLGDAIETIEDSGKRNQIVDELKTINTSLVKCRNLSKSIER